MNEFLILRKVIYKLQVQGLGFREVKDLDIFEMLVFVVLLQENGGIGDWDVGIFENDIAL